MFTAPHSGIYLITFSYQGTNDDNEETYVWVLKDGAKIHETQLAIYNYIGNGRLPSAFGRISSTSGLAVYQKLKAGNKITLHTAGVTGDMWNTNFCVEFLHN